MVECYICKGRLTLRECGKKFCPLYADKRWLNVKALKDEQFEGTSPSIFVGRFGYPKLNVGFLSLPELKENAWIYDAPQAWSKKQTSWDCTGSRNEFKAGLC
ncbi:hypothetical protein HZB88_04185 [archaeon]|nr:hypothetical protein [archaeon]